MAVAGVPGEPRKSSERTGAPPAGVYGWSGTRSRTRRATYSPLVPPAEDLLLPRFVAVDFETANRRGGVSACQVAMVRVEQGVTTDRVTTYIRPPSGYDSFEFTWLHGISKKDTLRAPMWDQVSDRIAEFVGDDPVYAHNASFDWRVWRDLDAFFDVHSVPNRFYCTYRLAQRVIPGLPNYKLPTVVHACAPEFVLNHHKADSDAEACALIVSKIQGMPAVKQLLG